MTDFRRCLTCKFYSQANYIAITRTIKPEFNWVNHLSTLVTLWKATAPVKLPNIHVSII